MSLRNDFGFALVACALALVSGSTVASRAWSADDKEACLSAADQGQSFRDDGKYLSAREQFVTCSRDVCPRLVHGQCTEWLKQIDESIPTVVFALKDDQGSDVATARVSVDGKAIATSIDGKPVPLDPGPHDVRFERDDPSQSVGVHVILRAGEKERAVNAVFPAVEHPAASGGQPGDTTATTSPEPESPSKSSGFWNGRSITSASLLGAGVVSVGLGVYFGMQSQSENNQAGNLRGTVGRSGCPTPSTSATCQQLSDAVDAQNRDAVLNEVFYVAGGVLAAGAVATWFLWPTSDDAPHPSAIWVAPVGGPAVAGVRVGGAF